LYDQQQAEIARLKDLIKRNMGADANASNIRHKTQGRIDRMEKVEAPRADTRTVRARIDAKGAGRIGREVVRLSIWANPSASGFCSPILMLSLSAATGSAWSGPNGAGKTTLVRILLGEETTTGALAWGHNVRHAYFSQHACDDLRGAHRPGNPDGRSANLHRDRGAQLPGPLPVHRRRRFKKVALLSGGEKNKLALARMLLDPVQPADPGRTDEPSGHRLLRNADPDVVAVRGHAAA
jgi:ATP-binding cassette subfamily F protein 3